MGDVFPFEVGKVPFSAVNDYGESIRIQSPASPDIPKEIALFVDVEIIDELPNPVILDYVEVAPSGIYYQSTTYATIWDITELSNDHTPGTAIPPAVEPRYESKLFLRILTPATPAKLKSSEMSLFATNIAL